MAIEIREMLIRAIIGNESEDAKPKNLISKKKKEKGKNLRLVDDISKLLQQTQER